MRWTCDIGDSRGAIEVALDSRIEIVSIMLKKTRGETIRICIARNELSDLTVALRESKRILDALDEHEE